MQQGYPVLKSLLDRWSTGRWEVHRAKLLLVDLVVVAFVGKR
jgi:hypothetical protein